MKRTSACSASSTIFPRSPDRGSDTVRLQFEFQCTVVAEQPTDVGPTDAGVLRYHVLPSAEMIGDRITASSLHPGADWFRELSDGYGRIDVRMLMQTNDGAVIHVAYQGLVEPTDTLSRAVQSLTPTAFTDQAIHTTWRLSTGDEQYRWVNRGGVHRGRTTPTRWRRTTGHATQRLSPRLRGSATDAALLGPSGGLGCPGPSLWRDPATGEGRCAGRIHSRYVGASTRWCSSASHSSSSPIGRRPARRC